MSKTFCITKASTALHALLLKTAPAEIEKKTSKSHLKELTEIAANDGTISYQEKVLLQALTEHNNANKSILKGLQEPNGLNQTYCLSLKKKPSKAEAVL